MIAEAKMTYSKENRRCTLALFSSVLLTRYFRNALSTACREEVCCCSVLDHPPWFIPCQELKPYWGGAQPHE